MLSFCSTFKRALSLHLLWLVGLTFSAGAQTVENSQAQRDSARARIAAERQAIAQRLSQQEVACYQRFAVEDCLRKARTQARTEDNALRREELEINDAERREKSANRLRSIEKNMQEPRAKAPVDGKLRSSEAAPDATLSAGSSAAQVSTQRAQQARERAQAQSQHQQSHAAEQARKQAMEAERRAAARARYEAKQLRAQQRREQAKGEELSKPKAAPLPPAAAS